MRHAKRYKKLGRTTSHRIAMFRNMLASLVEHGRIKTTLAKAKALRPVAEKLITKSRHKTVPAQRHVRRWLPNRAHVQKMFDEVGPRFADRDGGYLRIIKLGPRAGDSAEMALIEFVDYEPKSGG